MELEFKLEKFEGPLDLLLHLIEKNKVDIYDIPIAEITDQYMDYVRQMQEERLAESADADSASLTPETSLDAEENSSSRNSPRGAAEDAAEAEDMDVMSEFLVMAATLLDIKCRMLLPKEKDEEGEEEDPRAELVQKLLEYKMYKYMSAELRDLSQNASRSFYRKKNLPKEVRNYIPPVNYEELLGGTTLAKLSDIFRDTMKRQKYRVDPVRSKFGRIEKEEVDLSAKELYIKAYLNGHRDTDFRSLLEGQDSRDEIIVAFLVVLELMKTGNIEIEQDDLFGEITIHVVKDITADSGSASEFE